MGEASRTGRRPVSRHQPGVGGTETAEAGRGRIEPERVPQLGGDCLANHRPHPRWRQIRRPASVRGQGDERRRDSDVQDGRDGKQASLRGAELAQIGEHEMAGAA